jgi:hypothetical protein
MTHESSAFPATSPLHTERPSVYLDQWVWIRLGKAAAGEPRGDGDEHVLAEFRAASSAGVAFPLSKTHYFETLQRRNPRDRRALASVMAPISRFRTLRGGRALLRHQMLNAMHESFGRPTFRPTAPEVLGLGVGWAFLGEPNHLQVYGPRGRITESDLAGVAAWERLANQHAETRVLAGPTDDEATALRALGYRPETAAETATSRLEWERVYEGQLRDDRVSREELRVRVQVRELLHEHFDLFSELLAEYRLDLGRALGVSPDHPGTGRPKMVAFGDRIPSMRLAVDLKAELFRNAQRGWRRSDLQDIDALSVAVPYCHVVVADGDMADRLARARAAERHGTLITSDLHQVVDVLPRLKATAAEMGGDSTGWDAVGPGEAFSTEEPPVLRRRVEGGHLRVQWSLRDVFG